MKIEEISSSEKYEEEHDYRSFYILKINDKKMFDFSDGEPEDANMGRDFNDVYNILEALELAYKAGKNGEPFEVTSKMLDDWGY